MTRVLHLAGRCGLPGGALIEHGYPDLNELVAAGHAGRLRLSHQPNPMMSLAVSMVPLVSLAVGGGLMTWVGIDYDDAEDARFVHYYVPRLTNDGHYLVSRGRRVVPERPGRILATRRSDELAIDGKLGQCLEESALFTRKLLQHFGVVRQSRKATRALADQLLSDYSELLRGEDRLTEAAGAFTGGLWGLVVGKAPSYLSGLMVNTRYLECQKEFAVTAARAGLLPLDKFFWLVCPRCASRLATVVALMDDDLEIWATCTPCSRRYVSIYGSDDGFTVVPRVILDDAFDISCRHNLGLGVSYPKALTHLEQADELARKVASLLEIEVPGRVWLTDYDDLARSAAALLDLPEEASELVSALMRAPLMVLLCAVGQEFLKERFSLLSALLRDQ